MCYRPNAPTCAPWCLWWDRWAQGVCTSHCTERCFLPNTFCWWKNALGDVEKRNNSTLCLHGSQLNSLRWGNRFFLPDEIHLYAKVQGSVLPFCWASTQESMICLVNIKRGFLKCCLLSCGTELISLNLRWVCGIENVRDNDTWLEVHKVRKRARDSHLV